MIPHDHYFFGPEGRPNFFQGTVVCVICGESYARLTQNAPRTPEIRTLEKKSQKAVNVTKSPTKVELSPEEIRQTHYQGRQVKVVTSNKTAAQLASESEFTDVIEDGSRVDADRSFNLRNADDVFSYENTFGDRHLAQHFLDEAEEDIRRIESGLLDPSERGAF